MADVLARRSNLSLRDLGDLDSEMARRTLAVHRRGG
jgi:hypothetical protein